MNNLEHDRAYDAARRAASFASASRTEAAREYRTGVIGDEEFIAVHEAWKSAHVAFDLAEDTYIQLCNNKL